MLCVVGIERRGSILGSVSLRDTYVPYIIRTSVRLALHTGLYQCVAPQGSCEWCNALSHCRNFRREGARALHNGDCPGNGPSCQLLASSLSAPECAWTGLAASSIFLLQQVRSL